MITRALLSVAKMWNPGVAPKYAFVDFDERERSSLEIVYPNIQVYLCDFHREQEWNRWVNKVDNGVERSSESALKKYRTLCKSC